MTVQYDDDLKAVYTVDRVQQCVTELKAAGVDSLGIGAELFAVAFAELTDTQLDGGARAVALVELDQVLARRVDIVRKTCLAVPASEENREQREKYAHVVKWAQRAADRGLAKGLKRGDMAIELLVQSLAMMLECPTEVARLVAIGWWERKTDEMNAVVLAMAASGAVSGVKHYEQQLFNSVP